MSTENTEPSAPFICRTWGHDWEPAGMYWHSYGHCVRCGHEEHVLAETGLRGRLAAARCAVTWRAVDAWRALVTWFLPCRDCGQRFGRHDYAVSDHLPF